MDAPPMRAPPTFLLLWFLAIASDLHFSFCNGKYSNVSSCIEEERQALLRFKEDLTDPSSLLSSWAGNEEDCCSWDGVVCDNFSGHVRELHLQPSCIDVCESSFSCSDCERKKLGGKINPSLLNLKHLSYLNLSNNDFGGIKIPNFIGSLPSLRYLDLSEAGFSGIIPQTLGNLSSLHHLRIQHCFLSVEKLQWLSGLFMLQHLDLSCVNLSRASDWLQVTSLLPSLAELHFSYCQLDPPSSLLGLNFTSLAILDLSRNIFIPSMSNWLFSLTGLESLILHNCAFSGPIPSGLQNMTSLKYLDLYWNNLNSTIPNWLYNFKGLMSLNLGYNYLHGLISSDIGNMTSITDIYLSGNKIEGRIPRSMGTLCNAKVIDLSYNKFGDITNVFRSLSGCISNSLERLSLTGCKLSGSLTDHLVQFKILHYLNLALNSISGPLPWSLGRLSSLRSLNLAFNQLSGIVPESLGNLTKLEVLSISNNLLEGVVSEAHFANLTNLKVLYTSDNPLIFKVNPKWSPPFQLDDIDLRSCYLGPPFPNWLQSQKKLSNLDLSSTRISDTIPTWFWNLSSRIEYLNLSHNQIHGEIPYIPKLNFPNYHATVYLGSNQFSGPLPILSPRLFELDLSKNSFSGDMFHSLCGGSDETNQLKILNLGENLLSGEIPDCWMNWQSIEVINLGNNNLVGSIPSSIGFLGHLKSLQVRNNSLSGEFPLCLQNCTHLLAMDLGKNEFAGSMPAWIGKSLPNLKVLNLRSNKFTGEISSELCQLTSLQILDLANNKLSEAMPRCINNFTAMVTIHDSIDWTWTSYSFNFAEVLENAFVVTKGNEYQYSTILALFTNLDLSSNNLSGEIPKELTSLLGLLSINLSRNHLTGMIPKKIGDLKLLESIDFSRNQLSGEIPPSMSTLTFLGYFDLSYNNLSGKIPLSTQLQSFNATSFVGNKLCGPPLTQKCRKDSEPVNNEGNKLDKGKESGGDWFYLCMALGFAVGFWGTCGPLLFYKSWRYAYFQFLDIMWHKLCVVCGCW